MSQAADQARPVAGAASGLSLGPLADMIGFHLRLAQDASFQAFARRVGYADLKPGRFALLVLIAENPGVTPTELSRMSARDKSSITPSLRGLEARGLVQRRQAPGDRRSWTLELTAPGQAVLRELMVHAAAHDRELDRIIGAANKAQFLKHLQRIATELKTD